jgi:hypothetical protein
MAEDIRVAGKKAYDATSLDKLNDMSLGDMEEYYQVMCKALPYLDHWGEVTNFQYRIATVRREIAMLRSENLSERHHREEISLGRWTFWMALAAVVVPVILFVIPQRFPSKPQPARTDISNAPTSRQIPETTSESTEPEASSSTAIPSPEPTVTIAP